MVPPQSPARLRPFQPTRFGRYTLLAPLATGGMGELYLARVEGAQGFEKLCVIKKILSRHAADVDFVQRFVHEARTLVSLSHGAIAQVLDMGIHEGDAYIALEYVDGKDLGKVAARVRDRGGTLPIALSLFIAGRVLDALAYAHRKRDDADREVGLVHRDVSPPNVLVSYEGEVKLVDFGLAKSSLSGTRTHPSMLLGKFQYMSPEQARHEGVDRRSDLYSLALCLYELVAGRHPFEGAHPGELLTRAAKPEIPPLRVLAPAAPAALEAILGRALDPDRERRFQGAEELRGQLLSCLYELDPAAGPEALSRAMRELFSAEYQAERRLLASVRAALREGAAAPRTSGRAQERTDTSARVETVDRVMIPPAPGAAPEKTPTAVAAFRGPTRTEPSLELRPPTDEPTLPRIVSPDAAPSGRGHRERAPSPEPTPSRGAPGWRDERDAITLDPTLSLPGPPEPGSKTRDLRARPPLPAPRIMPPPGEGDDESFGGPTRIFHRAPERKGVAGRRWLPGLLLLLAVAALVAGLYAWLGFDAALVSEGAVDTATGGPTAPGRGPETSEGPDGGAGVDDDGELIEPLIPTEEATPR